MLETFLFALGIITGFTINALTNAGRFKRVEKTEEINKIEQLIEENKYLSDQVIGCKNRLDILTDKSDLVQKSIYDEFAELKQEIEYFQHIQGENSSDIRKIVKNNKENKELMCKQANNLKNCIVNKKRRR